MSTINITAGEDLDPGDAVKIVGGRAFRVSDWKTTKTRWPASNGWAVTETRHIPHRTNRLHRRPAKWWRHPGPWSNQLITGAWRDFYLGWYFRKQKKADDRLARSEKNGKA